MKLKERPRGLFDDVLGVVAVHRGGLWFGGPLLFVMRRGGIMGTRNRIERICSDGSYSMPPRRKAKAT